MMSHEKGASDITKPRSHCGVIVSIYLLDYGMKFVEQVEYYPEAYSGV